MSWMQKLVQTYDSNKVMVRVEESDGVPLLPLCHTTQKAHIEIILDGRGNFLDASVIPRDDARTIIPCTERSGGRTSGEAPHPLCDKLQYVAMDFVQFTRSKKPYFGSYIEQLENWCNSPFSHPKIKAVLKYVKKGSLIADLINQEVFVMDEAGLLIQMWDSNKNVDKPPIFDVLTNQIDAFIRWQVQFVDDLEPRVWRDSTLWESWQDYYISGLSNQSICYVTGQNTWIAEQHLAKLRSDGDKAKIISANDTSGYTFRGRFEDSEQAAAIGLEATQKAHLALRWLISRQGYIQGDLAVVAWSPGGASIPQPLSDTWDFLGWHDLPSDDLPVADTAQAVAIQFSKRLAGYSSMLGNLDQVIVIALDSATTGRLAITYYRELKGSDYLDRVEEWHNTCSWLQTDVKNVLDRETASSKWKRVSFIGAPAPKAIAEAAYGTNLDDKLRKATVSRILPWIVDGLPIPRDLVESAVRRASNRVGIKDQEDKYENDWNKTLGIACALFRKYNRRESYSMTLDLERKTRDYLYGRLLALADNIESWALGEAGENRTTNAARLMQRFSQRPYSTWRTIELALTPYKARLGGKANSRLKMIDEVIAAFDPEDFLSDKPLTGEFLLGYHSQREYFRYKTQSDQSETENEN
jgi:CRISPR-associated protein Csd1